MSPVSLVKSLSSQITLCSSAIFLIPRYLIIFLSIYPSFRVFVFLLLQSPDTVTLVCWQVAIVRCYNWVEILINPNSLHTLSVQCSRLNEVVKVVKECFTNESDYTGAKFYYQMPFISSSELCSRI